MSDLLKKIDRRTKLAGMNRMELLLFTLHDDQRFGINVFKVREVIRTPHISPVPKSDPRIVGIADIFFYKNKKLMRQTWMIHKSVCHKNFHPPVRTIFFKYG